VGKDALKEEMGSFRTDLKDQLRDLDFVREDLLDITSYLCHIQPLQWQQHIFEYLRQREFGGKDIFEIHGQTLARQLKHLDSFMPRPSVRQKNTFKLSSALRKQEVNMCEVIDMSLEQVRAQYQQVEILKKAN